jgi:protocatechuate 3,4-dioxygenase beta subunit
VPNSAHPPLDWPDYKSNRLRHPSRPLVPLPSGPQSGRDDLTLPVLGEDRIGAFDADLTRRPVG